MKKLILNYTFNASAKSITFKDYKSINLSGILSIKNLTRNVVIYILNTELNGRVVGNQFIYEGHFPSFKNNDKLQIWYVDNIPDEVSEPPVGSVFAGTSNATLGQVIFSNTNGVSFGINGQVITASVAPADGLVNFSAGTTSRSLSNVVFSNSNGISFGLNGSTITASVGAGGAAGTVSAGTTDVALGKVVFSNSNGISFGLNGSTLTAQHNALTSQSNQAISGSNGSFTFQTATFGNLNGLSFYTSNGSLVGSYTVPSTAGHISRINVSAGTTSNNLTNFILSNSNGVTFGLDGSTITASYSQSTHSHSSLVFSNDNNVTFGIAGSTLTASASYSNVTDYISIGESTNFLLTDVTSNFQFTSQMSDYQLTADMTNYQTTGNYLTTAMESDYGSNFIYSSASLDLTNISATLGSDTIALSVASQSIQPVAYSAGNGSALFSTLKFADSNGITWSTGTQGIYGTVATNYQSQGAYLTTAMASNRGSDFVQATAVFAGTNASGTIASDGISVSVNAQSIVPQNASLYALGNTTQNSSTVLSVNALSFNAIGSLTVGYSNGSIQLSAPNALTTAMASNRGSDFVQANAVFNGTNVSGTIASNAISVSVAAQSAQTGISSIALSNTTYTSGQISFRDGNGISWASTTGQGVSITHGLQFTSNTSAITSNALNTSQSSLFQHTSATSAITSNAVNTSDARIRAIAASDATYTSGSVTFRDLNGITWQSTTGQQIQITHGLQYTSNTSAITSNALNTSQSSLFRHTSQNSQLQFTSQMSDYLGTAQSSKYVQNWKLTGNTAGTTSSAQGTDLWLAGGNNITVSGSSNTISFSVGNYLTTARASTDAIGLNTAQSNVTWTVNSSGISLDGRGYAGTGTTFAGANISASMTNNSVGLNLSLSVAAPGAAAENNNINLLGANTAGNTTASGSTIGWSGQGVTLSGTNGSQVVISAPGTSSLSGTGQVSISVNGSTVSIGVPSLLTESGYNPYADLPMVAGQVGQGTLKFEPEIFPNFQCDRILLPMHNTNSSNSSGSHTLSFWVGIYTRNASSLSLYSSISASTALTHSGTAGSYSLYSGIRHFTIGMTNTFTEGEYWIGFLSRTTSGGANGSYSNMVVSNVNSAFQGFFGSSNNTTMQFTLGQGVYTVTTSGIPGSVAFSQIRGSDSMALRAPMMLFASSTI